MSQPYDRIFNFSAGPCTLPVEVLEEARDQLINYQGAGMSVMEMSHRGKVYEGIISQTEKDFRALMGISDDYAVLFVQGGASLMFSMLAMNFLHGGTADYVVTGSWGKKALEAAKLEGTANVVWDGKAGNYSEVPDLSSLGYTSGAAFTHFTSNETIQGVEFFEDPQLSGRVVCDMSSDICSRPCDVARYDLIYAGAQKNMGPAGVCVVIVKKEWLETVPAGLHPMLDLKLHHENDSMYNTPPCWTIYMCGLVYQHVLKSGGLSAMQSANQAKAAVIYDAIDSSGGFYSGHAKRNCRSIMNVTFTLPSEELTDAFLKGSKTHRLDGLKGHRSVGGCRASIYNAFPIEGCRELAAYMKDFACQNG